MISMVRQSLVMTWLNVKGISQRIWLSLAAVLGIGVVVAVMISFLSMADGFERTVAGTGSEEMAMILREGSQAELNSTLTLEQVKLLEDAPGIARENGKPLVSPELYVMVDGKKRGTGSSVNLPLRGLDERALVLRPQAKIIAGRMFEPGRNEIVVGRAAQEQFAGLDLGAEVAFGKTRWRVVGVFAADGAVYESELWADARIVQTLFRRGSSYQVMRVKLARPGDVAPIQAYIEADPRLNLDVKTEADYYVEQSKPMVRFIQYVGYPLSIIMGLGALAGALNTMYTSVAARQREIATLRAIGFGGFATFVGTLVESMVLAVLGGLLGCIAAYVFFDGLTASTLGQSFTQVVFDLHVSPALVEQGLVLAVTVGVVGGIFPAWRAAHLPILAAFHDI